ncbi:unnamed protein product, partial [Prorocentrum cordatum]
MPGVRSYVDAPALGKALSTFQSRLLERGAWDRAAHPRPGKRFVEVWEHDRHDLRMMVKGKELHGKPDATATAPAASGKVAAYCAWRDWRLTRGKHKQARGVLVRADRGKHIHTALASLLDTKRTAWADIHMELTMVWTLWHLPPNMAMTVTLQVRKPRLWCLFFTIVHQQTFCERPGRAPPRAGVIAANDKAVLTNDAVEQTESAPHSIDTLIPYLAQLMTSLDAVLDRRGRISLGFAALGLAVSLTIEVAIRVCIWLSTLVFGIVLELGTAGDRDSAGAVEFHCLKVLPEGPRVATCK